MLEPRGGALPGSYRAIAGLLVPKPGLTDKR